VERLVQDLTAPESIPVHRIAGLSFRLRRGDPDAPAALLAALAVVPAQPGKIDAATMVGLRSLYLYGGSSAH
jgi:hypothetical protein